MTDLAGGIVKSIRANHVFLIDDIYEAPAFDIELAVGTIVLKPLAVEDYGPTWRLDEQVAQASSADDAFILYIGGKLISEATELRAPRSQGGFVDAIVLGFEDGKRILIFTIYGSEEPQLGLICDSNKIASKLASRKKLQGEA